MLKKRLLAFLLSFAMVAQVGFVVSAAENEVLFDLEVNKMTPGPMKEYGTGITDTSTLAVAVDGGSNVVRLVDKDMEAQGGIAVTDIPLDDKITLSVDLKIVKGMVNIYLSGPGNPVSLVIGEYINYFANATGGGTATDTQWTKGKWTNFTVVLDPAAKVFDIYKNGKPVVQKVPIRGGSSLNKTTGVSIYAGDAKSPTEFDIRSLVVYSGEVVPENTEKTTDRILVDFSNAPERLNEALGEAVAMSIGNSMARVNNGYKPIDPDNKYVAPFVTEDGHTLIPTRFTTETIGCEVEVLSNTSFRFSKNGTVMEINMGDKNAIINGKAVEMPTTPVIKYDRLFIPLRFAAETFGKNVFWDDRGLIVISDEEVVEPWDADIIKPLLNEIRQQTTLHGNTKYSDVNFSARYNRTEGHMDGTTTPQWGSLNAAKRFMATVERWSYDTNPSTVKPIIEEGLIVQGSLQPIYNDLSKTPGAYFLDGLPYRRNDGNWSSYWGCVNDPYLYEWVVAQGKKYMDMGITAFQFDDWPVNANYHNGGCFCDFCMTEFPKFLCSENVSAEELEAAGITDPATFNYKEYLASIGVTSYGMYNSAMSGKPVDTLWWRFTRYKAWDFHMRVQEALEEYAGGEVYYSGNTGGIGSNFAYSGALGFNVDAAMGETFANNITPIGVFSSGLFTRAHDTDSVVSPMPESEGVRQLLNSAIPMYYATGQFALVPWDVWLYGSTRYYATLEELEHNFEFPREYPWLFDNYETPELIGYAYDLTDVMHIEDLDKTEDWWATPKEVMETGLPVRAIVHNRNYNYYVIKDFDEKDFEGLQAVVEGSDLSKITPEERAMLENSGVPVVSRDDKATMDYLKSTYWMTKSSDADVYTVLRQNQLYDNAPVVVHAVNYDYNSKQPKENVEIDINNLYLPEGEEYTVNIYKPGENSKSVAVKRGTNSTKITLDWVDNWAILEICGPTSVRREAKFDLGAGLNGIGLGSRVSNDKVYGTANDFTFVSYSEGINSATAGDNGNQDEAAFVYKRLGSGILKNASVSAQFSDADGAYGVMAREGVYSNARFAALVYDPDKGLRIAFRTEANEPVGFKDINNTKPAYMKLERKGREYVAYTSKDGKTFNEVGRVELELAETVAGVLAYSSDGLRSQCRVRNLAIKNGKSPEGAFTSFKISYPGGKISEAASDEKLVFELSTEDFTNIPPEELDVTFTISDNSVLAIEKDGTIIPKKAGKVTVTADVVMGLRKASDSTTIEVTPIDHTLFAESFDGGKLPDGISASQGNAELKDGALRLTVGAEGSNVITNNIYFDAPKNKNIYYEFDFRAHFGETQPTTGAGVLWGNNDGFAMTCDVNEWNWFFRDDQRFVTPMEGDRWYHIKIYINYEEQYADVYVDDELIVDNGELKKDGISPEGIFWVRGWRLGLDTYYEWDNFNIYFE